jgi:ADP-heptose:LPS heptosyltransferase
LLPQSLWKLLPDFELTRLRGTNLNPASAPDFSRVSSICLATKSRNLGDALALTTLPEKLKSKWPQLRITTLNRAFNPVVFWNNPFVDGLSLAPSSVFGDDCNLGSGQLIQLKESFFGITPSRDPRPRLFLNPRESLNPVPAGKPVLCLHPSGSTRQNILSTADWSQLIQTLSGRFHVLQLGVTGDREIPGVSSTRFFSRGRWSARELFATVAKARAFVGVDSGPMHVARAFQIPSVILLNHAQPETVFRLRKEAPYFLHQNYLTSVLYESNHHIDVSTTDLASICRKVSACLTM